MTTTSSRWAVILGASSGFGEAAALELAAHGYDIFGVHLDRRKGMANVAEITEAIEAKGRKALFLNINAADAQRRKEAVAALLEAAGGAPVRLLMHSLAFGTLKPYIAADEKEAMNQAQIEMTLDVMANSLVYWTQDLHRAGLLRRGSKIYAMTSSGDHVVWKAYGAVSAAKCALESHIRQLAVELSPEGITANSIRAGVTDTPALRKIPGNEAIVESATKRNPAGRLTTPQDVATCLVALSGEGTEWMTGNVINVDGGEDVAG